MKRFRIIRAIMSMTRTIAIGVTNAMLMVCLVSCEDFVDVAAPQTLIVGKTVFEEDATALSVLANVYNNMNRSIDFASGARTSVSFLQGLTSDELALFSSTSPFVQWNANELNSEMTDISALWGNLYHIIYITNEIISGSQNSTILSSDVKAKLEGEAKFIRAFCHFYLVNLFGDTPYIRSTDYRANSVVSRTPSSQVYQFIIDDLLDAQELLLDTYPSEGRVRPNKWAATALLSRVYLYMGEWEEAEQQATSIINNTSVYSLVPIDQVFLRQSNEAIWQLDPVGTAQNSFDGETFIIVSTPQWAILSNNLFNAFEVGDARKTNWIGTYTDGTNSWNFPYKYKKRPSDPETEYSVVLRLGEQFLIRAEARTQQDKLTEAIADVDVIRGRAVLPLIANTTPAITKANLLLAIEQERRIELFTEWGHRWFDLKRTNRSNAVLSVIKPDWDDTDVLLPLPQSELLKNHNLEPQNPGY